MTARLALAALLLATQAAATPLGPVVADFTETLDLNPTHDGPRVLQDLGAVASLSPDLADDEELSNPSAYAGSLVVDLATETGLLTLTPTNDNCYATIDVAISDMDFAAQVTGLVLREKRAIDAGVEASPFFTRTMVFTRSSLRVANEFLVVGLRCPLFLSAGHRPDVFEVNPVPVPHADLTGARFDFRETLTVGAVPTGPRILVAGNETIGPGAELTEADESQNPGALDGALEVDLDPATGRLVLTPTLAQCFRSIVVELTDSVPTDPNAEIAGVALVSTGAFDDEAGGDASFRRTVTFGERSIAIDYRDESGNCALDMSGSGADTYQIFVPEPSALAAGCAAGIALLSLRRRT